MPYDTLKDFAPITMVTSVKVVRSPEFEAETVAQGITAIGNTPEEFARVIRADMEKWAKLLKKTQLQAD